MTTARPETGPTIRISTGTGSGRTTLSAFDAALRSAGVADFNLLRLSSIIPPGSTVLEVGAADQLSGAHGDRLYCVYAEAHAELPHHEAWAGIAWAIALDGSGGGLFVEHEGPSREQVDRDLTATLEDLVDRRGGGYEIAGRAITSAMCETEPVCAVVIASYAARGWSVE
ncbi:Pyruvoyl-dependent arginine decarboxylase [Beutenbergia cavernae DSM 12333]|uniref:Pyruvoyl-dependent arginine decarboxylase AaxB n=1 Tax=Beutenbergia cavernae (strain ATCC BAA-8 / DSM 12333 / CCUG 43141 / JCM 11478 / NBRC 16432 / NCIMB 13614 / HKI 0122) TaxID=471853 RepID=C5BZE7_BEUC1|nr:pyruvoyl-dependent arginine decarboxylase [Beutenbergia cavernae]ACQ79119.1 Pyruvoyl-dependent arginine decarboxylase [Beutenbergia cavernae DSM 12333]